MKAAVLKDDKKMVFEEVPMPEPGPGQVLIRVSWASVCGTDLHIFMGEFKNRVAYPRILGHEFSGVIETVGQGVKHLQAGDRVTADPIVWCNECPACLNGQNNVCRNLKLLGIEFDGGFAQFTVAGYALAQFAFAYSLIAQVGVFVDKGYGQVVWKLSELMGSF